MAAPEAQVSVAGRVADQLRDLIRDGAYAPGARLVERSIARELGTSHIPVREALARLAEEGLVVRLPRRGARVAELSGLGHWWMLQDPVHGAEVLEGFWKNL